MLFKSGLPTLDLKKSGAYKSSFRTLGGHLVDGVGKAVDSSQAFKSSIHSKTASAVGATLDATDAFKSAVRTKAEDSVDAALGATDAFKSAVRTKADDSLASAAAFKSAVRAQTDAFKSALRAKAEGVVTAFDSKYSYVPGKEFSMMAPYVPAGCLSAYDTAVEGGLSTLAAAIDAAGLKELLDNPGLVATVFAPTNDAFDELIESTELSAEEVLADTELLGRVLRYHVIPGKSLTKDTLLDGNYYPTLLFNTEDKKSKRPYEVQVDYEKTIDLKSKSVTETWAVNEAEITGFPEGKCPTSVFVIDTVLSPPEDEGPMDAYMKLYEDTMAIMEGDDVEEVEDIEDDE